MQQEDKINRETVHALDKLLYAAYESGIIFDLSINSKVEP